MLKNQPSNEPELVVLHDQAHPNPSRDFRHSYVADFMLDDYRHIKIYADRVSGQNLWVVDLALSHEYTNLELSEAKQAVREAIAQFYTGANFDFQFHFNPKVKFSNN